MCRTKWVDARMAYRRRRRRSGEADKYIVFETWKWPSSIRRRSRAPFQHSSVLLGVKGIGDGSDEMQGSRELHRAPPRAKNMQAIRADTPENVSTGTTTE